LSDEQLIRAIIGRALVENERAAYAALEEIPPQAATIVAIIVKRDRILACEYLQARVPDTSSMEVKLAAYRIDRDGRS
jgi:hypothetical protein